MLAKSLLVAALSALAVAKPVLLPQGTPPCPPGGQPTVPTLPANGGAVELPAPGSSLKLKAIALGHGIQNYTCASANASASGTAAGALAVLYDITSLYPKNGPASLPSVPVFESLPVTAARNRPLPLNISPNTTGCVLTNHPGAVVAAPFPNHAAAVSFDPLRATANPVGRHYFDASATPTFDLGKVGLFSGSAKDKIAAPSKASPGPDGQPAVPWLHLVAKTGGPSHGITDVYRVSTVGGTSQQCTAPGTLSVPYAAIYWFYG